MSNNTGKFFVVVFIGFIFVNACASPPMRRSDYPSPPVVCPPKVIAILPFDNQSNDLDAPEILRTIFKDYLSRKEGYVVKPLEDIDKVLETKGIIDAGQLPTISLEELNKELNVDGIIYGELIDFSYVTLGVYMKRAVKAEFKLFNAKTGDLIWNKEKSVSHTEITSFKNAGKAFAKQLKDKVAEKVLSSPLRIETEELVRKIMITFPPNNW